jgi:chromosome segregation ATPase
MARRDAAAGGLQPSVPERHKQHPSEPVQQQAAQKAGMSQKQEIELSDDDDAAAQQALRLRQALHALEEDNAELRHELAQRDARVAQLEGQLSTATAERSAAREEWRRLQMSLDAAPQATNAPPESGTDSAGEE